ncbi:hypothetical protein [Streptomyces sp. UG1]|uniref:hypothetical protein n=1 Tax=Streptomyces sp. UG1 TaxID=3417652 RepID=UPI003CE76023
MNAWAVSNLPLREGEREAIAWMSFDTADGVDYGLVPYTRSNGEPIFDEPEVFTVPLHPRDKAPGRILLRTLTRDGTQPTDL